MKHTIQDAVMDHRLDRSLATKGLRSTRQRHHVFNVLLHQRDHPTAEDVFIRAKQEMPEISFATVYNCLDTLTQCGLVRQVHLDRSPTRFCPNMQEHGHFHCDACGCIVDIDLAGVHADSLPSGFKAVHCETTIRGLCPDCSESSIKKNIRNIRRSKGLLSKA